MTERAPIRLFIDGQLRDAADGRTFDDIDPATGTPFAAVAHAGREDVDRAVDAAQRALRGPWARMGAVERARLLRRVADEIERRSDDFLRAEVRDTGKPASLARTVDVPRGAANFRVFADLVAAHGTTSFVTETPDGRGAINYALRNPVGVVGVICPWNLPLLLMTWKVAPALACGNTVVVKPSEETPATATLLGEAMKAAGIPDGVFNVVHGFGPDSAGEHITRHPGIHALTFTGESRTGQTIMRAAAAHVKPVSFELGGKNAAIVFDDADFEAAVAGTIRSVFTNCGQVCLCSERVYVHRSLYDRFVERLAQEAERLRPGDPWHDATTLGPLISANHRDKVLGYLALARQEGATVVTGGTALAPEGNEGGFFVAPTIWTGLPESARCVREEVFGPVCHIRPFDDEDEVVALANDSDYGLCAAVWTTRLDRAHRVAARLDVGIVWVNTWFLRDLRTPFGGAKLSGLGREGGVHSLDFYTELRNICIKL